MPNRFFPMQRFRRDIGGAAAVVFGLAIVPIIGATGLAVDYSHYEQARAHLQDAVDSAALAAVTASGGDFSSRTTAMIEATARAYVRENNHHGDEEVAVAIDADKRAVTVKAQTRVETYVAHFVGVDEIAFGAEATARLDGRADPVCLLALDPDKKQAIEFTGPASVTAPNCAIHANSAADNALFKRGPSTVTAASFCAVGGHDGDFSPVPDDHCRRLADPFADLAIPEAKGPCDAESLRLAAGPATLKPGLYCGGIEFRTGAEVTLEPGTYLIADGPLDLAAHARVSGDGVTFVFSGKDGNLNVHAHGALDVKAPTEGPLAGFVMVEDHGTNEASRSFIHGSGDIRIVGTVYLPTHEIRVFGSGAVNERSEQIAMIANNFVFKGDSASAIATTFNADYEKAGFETPVVRLPLAATLVD